MSLLSARAPLDTRSGADYALLHKMECRACPLDKLGGKLEPTGSETPLVYVLGEGAGKNEIEEREQFVGASGKILRSQIPRKYRDKIRYNNVVRSRPPGNATPTPVMVECCRPSVTQDIERTKPPVIFGFGNTPLEWVSGFTGGTVWRGRRMPVRVGQHVCWYYAFLHPAYLLHNRRGGKASAEEHIFALDLQRAFSELESLPPPVLHGPADVTRNTELITGAEGAADLRRLREALTWAAAQPVIGLDYETNGLRPYNSDMRILTAAVATGERAVSFALEHPEAAWSPQQLGKVQELWEGFLEDRRALKVAHNLAFEFEWSLQFFYEGAVRRARWGDTMTQAAVIDERTGRRGGAGPLSLEFLVQQYYGFNLKKLFGVDRSDLANTPLETVLAYNAPDARYAALLFQEQDRIIKSRNLTEAYELALRAIPTATFMQRRGLPVDQTEVRRLLKKYDADYERIAGELAALPVVREFERRAQETFKPLSNPNVLFVLKDIMGRKEVEVQDKYTKKQKYSADEKVLSQIEHPFARKLVELRKVNKQRSTYITPLLKGHKDSMIYEDGLLHAQFNTVFAETGRWSSSGPNLQNFPKRNAGAKEVRKQVVAAPGCRILAFDFGQLEARVIAAATRDESFCKSLWERYDIHQEWAERLARAYPARVGGKKGLTDKGVMKTFRTDVKNQWTFPLFFGAKLESAAGYLNIPPDTIAPLYKEFWRQFSGVKKWQQEQVKGYEERGYTECLTGKRRHGPMSLNQILNSPIQGTAAALVVDVASRLYETEDPEVQPEIQIHDDLTFVRVPKARVDPVAEKILDVMLKPVFSWMNVPLTVEGSLGADWMDMEDFGVFSSDEWWR